MKYRYLFLIVLLFTACTRVKYIEFKGNMPDITSGVFVIKDINNNTVYTESIFNGQFDVKKILQYPGYYNMYITPDVNKDYKKRVYDVYLDAGTYTISIEKGKSYKYPSIKSSSEIQNELSDYYISATEWMHDARVKVDALTDSLYGKNAPIVNSNAYNILLKQLNQANKALDNAQSAAFEDYVDKHPESQVEAHILSGIDYKTDPGAYYRIYQKFNKSQKNSSDGKTEDDDLNYLAKLGPGALAPKLLGKLPDGKPFDPAAISKKIILVDFWRSDVDVSRQNHAQLLKGFDSPLKNKDFTIVSVSLDTVPDTWKEAIKDDKMTWTQLCDFKGENSPNIANWGVNTIPTYDLVDGSWHIIKLDVDFNQINIEVDDYLKKKDH